MLDKYPRTSHWPSSPAILTEDDALRCPDPEDFIGCYIVITEKLDGSNTLLFDGELYGRSVSAPSNGKWHAMTRKHHAWKLTGLPVMVYGEDIYGVHSIEYEPVPEEMAFYVFAIKNGSYFYSWDSLTAFAGELGMPVVPQLWFGYVDSHEQLDGIVRKLMDEPSKLGGEREGVVIRAFDGFWDWDFSHRVCKSVRANHIQTDEHWTRNWKTCAIRRNPLVSP